MTIQKEDYTLNKKAWLRYLARISDMFFTLILSVSVVGFLLMIFTLIFGIILKLFSNPVFPWDILSSLPVFVQIIFMTILYLFIEAKIISQYGTTPFKKLLGISIVDINGKKLDYKTSLKRNLTLWFKGLGFTIPIISLIALIMSYNGYVEQGTTPWDEDNRAVVLFEPISNIRLAIGIIMVISTFILNAYFSFQ
ncbi:RDD domain containing protein [sediment metagenome]|uniref:RDD domain containing protein n=1 Tax=sediment metagenome TaxID=749907 RepID=D9PFX4_9ZZZZ